jgi:radial spoke head protein 9
MYCLGHKGFPERRFFFCTTKNWKFSELPQPIWSMAKIFDQITCYFTGQHERQIVDRMGFSAYGHMNIEGVDMKCMPSGGLNEFHRLCYVVYSIEKNCQIVPCAAYKKNTLGEVSPNEAFSGLPVDKLDDLNSYMHLRPVQQAEKKDLASREEDIFNHEFLDCVALDVPYCSWSCTRDPINPLVATLKSCLWPGYYAYHRANTGVYGGVYMGDGIKNIDLQFML